MRPLFLLYNAQRKQSSKQPIVGLIIDLFGEDSKFIKEKANHFVL